CPTLQPARTAFIPTPQLRAARADTLLEHMCHLGIDSPPITARCTISPASLLVETPQETMKSGMNVARVHLSLRTCGYHAGTITTLEIFASVLVRVAPHTSNPILYLPGAVALNTKGREIRRGLIKRGNGLQAQVPGGGRGSKVWVDDGGWGSKVWVADSLLSLPAKQKGPYILETEVESGGFLGSKKGVKLPLAAVHLPALSGEGIQDLKAGEVQDLDRVFASFTHRVADGREVGKVLGEGRTPSSPAKLRRMREYTGFTRPGGW
uniref:pyruvate kinase n=1 Tax=Oryctolagus cuniculus TaxID=9986 RepID=A0A5F9CHB4_RABIT